MNDATLGFMMNLRFLDLLIIFVVLGVVALVLVAVILHLKKPKQAGGPFPVQPSGVTPPFSAMPAMQVCANCRRTMGDLEERMTYKEQIVCKQCFAMLTR